MIKCPRCGDKKTIFEGSANIKYFKPHHCPKCNYWFWVDYMGSLIPDKKTKEYIINKEGEEGISTHKYEKIRFDRFINKNYKIKIERIV